ncbi:MAG: hypothetical protein RR427_10590 [Cellulosilyticaceae bacterium]
MIKEDDRMPIMLVDNENTITLSTNVDLVSTSLSDSLRPHVTELDTSGIKTLTTKNTLFSISNKIKKGIYQIRLLL